METTNYFYANQMHSTIRNLNAHGLYVISTAKQVLNGTIMVKDPLNDEVYTIHKSGYARRRVIGWLGTLNHYQLNPTKTTKRGKYGVTVKRILFPGQYYKLSEIVIRINNAKRK